MTEHEGYSIWVNHAAISDLTLTSYMEKPKHAEQNYEEEQRSATPAESPRLWRYLLIHLYPQAPLVFFTYLSKTALPYDF